MTCGRQLLHLVAAHLPQGRQRLIDLLQLLELLPADARLGYCLGAGKVDQVELTPNRCARATVCLRAGVGAAFVWHYDAQVQAPLMRAQMAVVGAPTCASEIRTKEWLRDEPAFIPVADVALFSDPCRIRSSISCSNSDVGMLIVARHKASQSQRRAARRLHIPQGSSRKTRRRP